MSEEDMTKEEQEALSRRMMVEMFEIIKPIAEDADYETSVKRILSAIQRAEEIKAEADAAFKKAHPKRKLPWYYIDVMDLAATCVAAVVTGGDSIDGFVPNSLAGSLIACFARASWILSAANDFQVAIEGEISSYAIDFVMKII